MEVFFFLVGEDFVCLVTSKWFWLFLCLGDLGMEQFVTRVFQGGKVTIPKRVRELLGGS